MYVCSILNRAQSCMQLPVNGDIVLSFVNDFDNHSVTIIHFQGWTWILPIHRDGVLGFAQPLHWCCLNLFHAKHQLAFKRKEKKKQPKKKEKSEKQKEIQKRKTYNKFVFVSNGICQSHCRRSKEKKNAKDDERALRIGKNVVGGFHLYEGFV